MQLSSLHLAMRPVVLVLVIALLATACGNDSSLQGDIASQTSATETPEDSPTPAPVSQTEEPAPTIEAQLDEPDEPDESVDLAPGVVVVTAAAGGAVDAITATEFTVRSVQATNSDIRPFLLGEPALDCCDRNYLVIGLSVENQIQRFWFTSRSDMYLLDPSGQEYEVQGLYNREANQDSTPSFAGHDARLTWLVVETEELFEDVSDWDLVIAGVGGEEVLPILLPLSGPAYTHSYPLALAAGTESEFASGEFSQCDGTNFSTVIDSAEIVLEDLGTWSDKNTARKEPIRVGAGDRLVRIELAISSQSEFLDTRSTRDCGWDLFWPDMLLDVDGFQVKPIRQNLSRVRTLAAQPATFVYKIRADAEQISLLGGVDQAVLGSWAIDLPVEVGEPDAALVIDPAAVAPDVELVMGARPSELTSQVVTEGGASGTFLAAEATLRTVTATNATPESIINGQPELADNASTFVIAELEVLGAADAQWGFFEHHFVLQDATGRPYGSRAVFDQVGDELVTFNVRGEVRQLVHVVFETNGLVDDPTGWSVLIENGDDIPLTLPLVGEASTQWPRELSPVGKTAAFVTECDANFEIATTAAQVDLEGPRRDSDISHIPVARVDEDHRAVLIDVVVTKPDNASTGSCESPVLLLDVDGRLTEAYTYRWPDLDAQETAPLRLHYEVPNDAQTASLISLDGATIATWQLADDG